MDDNLSRSAGSALPTLWSSVSPTQTELYGTNHLYAADTFIEMSPPSDEPAFLANMAKALYRTMTAADPEAIWFMQGWIFYNNRKFWREPQAKAFLDAVPNDRMVLLDLFCDENPVWKETKAFHGKPWIWCILQNFGNVVQLHGRLPRVNQDLFAARSDPACGTLEGIGVIQEGLGYNPVAFDFMLEMTWRGQPADLDEWIQHYAHRRYGRRITEAEQAWKLLMESAYTGAARRGSLTWKRPSLQENMEPSKNQDKLVHAWKLLLDCSDELADVDTYQYDLTHITRENLSILTIPHYQKVIRAYEGKDRPIFTKAVKEFKEILLDLDTLLAAQEEFLLGKWLEDAKRWGTNEEEKRLYEWNARNVITLWGGAESRLHDYARKEWSGLLKDFYLYRWNLFFDRLGQALDGEKPLDEEAFQKEIQRWEEQWTHQTTMYPTRSRGDTVDLSRRFFQKYNQKQ